MVSVVMITYLHEAYIAEAINGVLMQQCDFDVELIIADDCSPDNTKVVVESFKDHPNFKWINYIRHDKNKGMMGNFIWALEQASGKYIALCEGDDYWTHPYKLQKQVDFLERNRSYSGVFHNQDIINSLDGLKWNKVNICMDPLPQIDVEVTFDDLLQGKYRVPTRTLLFERECGNFNILSKKNFLIGDLPMAFILTNSKPLFYINQNMAVYRLHENGISNNKNVVDIVHRREVYFKTWIYIFDWAYRISNVQKYNLYKVGINRYYKNLIKSNQSIKTNVSIWGCLFLLNWKRKTLTKEKFRFVLYQTRALLVFLLNRLLFKTGKK